MYAYFNRQNDDRIFTRHNFDENAVCNLRDLQNIALFTELKNSVRALRHGYHLTKKI